MKKKNRQLLTIAGLCILLAAAGIGYRFLLVQEAGKEKKEAGDDADKVKLTQMSSEEVDSLSFKKGRLEMSFVKKDGSWQLAEDEKYPVDQDEVIDMVDEASGAEADRVVTEHCEDLSEYELDAPELAIQLGDGSGNKTDLYIGMESISGGGRYAYTGDDPEKVYLISTSVYMSFDLSREELMEVPDIKEVDADKVTYFLLHAAKGDDFEAKYDKDNSPFKDIYSWEIDQPYKKPVAGDVDQLAILFGEYTDLSFSGGTAYRASSEDKRKYGLAQPSYEIKVKMKGNEELELMIGNQTADGSAYYVMTGDEKGIYLMDASSVETITDITPDTYVYHKE